MCGANDSRRVAERITDAFACKLVYSNSIYELIEVERENDNERHSNF